VTKKLDDVQKQTPTETKMPIIAESSKSAIPRASPKRRGSKGSKEPSLPASVALPESPELPTKIPRPQKAKEPVQDNGHESPGSVDFPVPASTSGSDDYHLAPPQNTRKPFPVTSSSSSVFGAAKAQEKPLTEPSARAGMTVSESERTVGARGTVKSEKRPEAPRAGTGASPPPPGSRPFYIGS